MPDDSFINLKGKKGGGEENKEKKKKRGGVFRGLKMLIIRRTEYLSLHNHSLSCFVSLLLEIQLQFFRQGRDGYRQSSI
jgi:hypothetical protein